MKVFTFAKDENNENGMYAIFNESFWHPACSVRVQQIHEVIVTKSLIRAKI